jgi:hypothetical protein
MLRKDTEMHASPGTYHGVTARTRLIAAALALAGSAAMVGGNLGIARYYAANAGIAQLMTASRGDAPRQIATDKCTNNAS